VDILDDPLLQGASPPLPLPCALNAEPTLLPPQTPPPTPPPSVPPIPISLAYAQNGKSYSETLNSAPITRSVRAQRINLY
jgi:hypothetical protein